MPIHNPKNTCAANQRRKNRSISKERGPIVIFIAESFLDTFNLSFIERAKAGKFACELTETIQNDPPLKQFLSSSIVELLTLRTDLRITRKSGHFLPKVWPRKKKPASPPCKPVYVPGRGKADTCARSVVFVTRMALQANLPMWPNFR